VQVLRVPFTNGGPPSPLRHASRDALTRELPGCTDDLVADALLVISELVQNVSQHTRSDGELVLSVVDGVILIEVHDDDPAAPRLRNPDGRQAGGRGLMLVAGMADNWGVRRLDTGKTVWARLPLAMAGGTLTPA
jgi:anti-sigma regulatory factor (Ser/Thr protein kinase)